MIGCCGDPDELYDPMDWEIEERLLADAAPLRACWACGEPVTFEADRFCADCAAVVERANFE